MDKFNHLVAMMEFIHGRFGEVKLVVQHERVWKDCAPQPVVTITAKVDDHPQIKMGEAASMDEALTIALADAAERVASRREDAVKTVNDCDKLLSDDWVNE